MLLLLVLWVLLFESANFSLSLMDEVMAYQSLAIQMPLLHQLLPSMFDLTYWKYSCKEAQALWLPANREIVISCRSDSGEKDISLWTSGSFEGSGFSQSLYYRKKGHKKVEVLAGVKLLDVSNINEKCLVKWEHCSNQTLTVKACHRIPKPGYCRYNHLCWPSTYEAECFVD